MDYSTPSFHILHHLPELSQTHVLWVSDAIQPSRPVSTPCPPAFNLSNIKVFSNELVLYSIALPSCGQNIGASASTSVLPMNIQDWFPLRLAGLISLRSNGLSRVFFNTTVQKHQFFSTQLSLQSSSSHLYMTTGKTIASTRWTFVVKVMSLFLICCLGWS